MTAGRMPGEDILLLSHRELAGLLVILPRFPIL